LIRLFWFCPSFLFLLSLAASVQSNITMFIPKLSASRGFSVRAPLSKRHFSNPSHVESKEVAPAAPKAQQHLSKTSVLYSLLSSVKKGQVDQNVIARYSADPVLGPQLKSLIERVSAQPDWAKADNVVHINWDAALKRDPAGVWRQLKKYADEPRILNAHLRLYGTPTADELLEQMVAPFEEAFEEISREAAQFAITSELELQKCEEEIKELDSLSQNLSNVFINDIAEKYPEELDAAYEDWKNNRWEGPAYRPEEHHH